jgi:hypothetical protein
MSTSLMTFSSGILLSILLIISSTYPGLSATSSDSKEDDISPTVNCHKPDSGDKQDLINVKDCLHSSESVSSGETKSPAALKYSKGSFLILYKLFITFKR